MVESSKVLPLNEAQLKREAIIRMAHTSTSIEGNPLAEYQVEKVLSGHSIAADEKSILEVKNYQQALLKIEELSKDSSKIRLETILTLHKILMKGLLPGKKTGSLREGKIYVVDDLGDGREKLRFEGPPAHQLKKLLSQLCSWEEKERILHPIVKAGVFHIEFVSIHPFPDGNGRLTRLLATLILYRAGWDFRRILVLDDYYNRNRLAYYNALNEVQGKSYHAGVDLTPWLEYFTGGFRVEAQRVADKILSIGFKGKLKDSKQIFLDKDEVKLMDFLTTVGRLTSADVVDLLGIPKRTAQFKLKSLVDKGLIKLHGKGPSVFYTILS